MTAWCPVTLRQPCVVCHKPDWCARSTDGVWALCRRVATGAGIHKTDKSGCDYWLYRLDGAPPSQHAIMALPAQPQPARADPLTLDLVYRALLAALPLTPAHRQALRRRGLPDADILRRRYRTLPITGRAALTKRLVEELGAEVCAQVPGVYVAERDGRCWWSLAGAAGLLTPVRDLDGHIVALKVRADDPGEGPKYTTISSAKHGGPGPGAQVHVPLHALSPGALVRITEGELKADTATALSGILTVSIPGVAMWRKALPILKALQPQRVLLAFDADWRTNPHVAQALGHAAFALVKAGYEVQVEDWEPTQGKGIDDLLAAGHTPALKPVALAFGAVLRGQTHHCTAQLRTIPAEEVPPWHSNV